MLDSRKIKSQLNTDHIVAIVKALGADPYKQTSDQIVFPSICHGNLESYKLYYYPKTSSFFCYSQCSCSYDIFSLVQKVKKISFVESMNYVIDVAGLEIEKATRINPTKNTDHWEDQLSQYLRIRNGGSIAPVYDKSILNFFPKIYHQSFIDDHITIETMEKYHLCFYPYRQQIVIPIFDAEGNLAGLHGRNLIPDLVSIGLKYQPIKLLDTTEYKFPTSSILYGLNFNKYNIENSREVILLEAPKGVLQMEGYTEHNNSVGMFGMNLQKSRRDMLLKFGIENVVIALDKQYEFKYNIDGSLTKEYLLWKSKVDKIGGLFKGLCNVQYIEDNGILEYKDAPTDKGKEVWRELYISKKDV